MMVGFPGFGNFAAEAAQWAGNCSCEWRFARIRAQTEADECLRRLHGRDQRGDAHDVDDAFEVVGQDVQRHFRSDPF